MVTLLLEVTGGIHMNNFNWVAGIVLPMLGIWGLLRLNRQKQSEVVTLAFYRSKDVKFVGLVVLPLSIGISSLLFWIFLVLSSVVLYHLSETNNLPALAAQAVGERLDREGCPAQVVVTRQDEPTPWIEVRRGSTSLASGRWRQGTLF